MKKCDMCEMLEGRCCAPVADLPPDAPEGIAGDDFNDTKDTVCEKYIDEYEKYHKAVG